MKKYLLILLILLFSISLFAQSEETKNEKEKLKHELEFPVFMQKGGLMRPDTHSIYLRTNDEWTGFSTFYIGYRYGVNNYFNIGVEFAISPIPDVLIGNILTFIKLYETPDKFFFLGLRTRTGYKYQKVYFDPAKWGDGFIDYLNINRNGLFFAVDVTAALRLGKYKQHSIYYSFYPRLEVDFVDTEKPIYFLFSPAMIGYEVRFGRKMDWNFAIEAGMTIPLPYDSLPLDQWVNFPSLANMTLSYRFGDEFYE